MARVTSQEVKNIIDTDIPSPGITPFIETANAMVEEHLLDQDISETLLTKIELWLAAHFVAVRDPRREAESLGDASDRYRGKTDMGLNFTEYGQQAIALDSSGVLASLGKQKAFLKVV